jgi:outer membrane lipoprotein LolB
LVLAVVGCATWRQPPPSEGGFQLRGKLGVVQSQDSFSARFIWLQQGDQFDLDLWGPLGQGRVQLVGDDAVLELREGDGTVISRGPPDEVMTRHLGWSLPLRVLPEWVRGRPAPDARVTHRTFDADGRLSGFRQLGWIIELGRYERLAAGVAATEDAATVTEPQAAYLPHRVTLRRGADRVRLAISEWRI